MLTFWGCTAHRAYQVIGLIFISHFFRAKLSPFQGAQTRFENRPVQKAWKQFLNHQPPHACTAQLLSTFISLSESFEVNAIPLEDDNPSPAVPEYPSTVNLKKSSSGATRKVEYFAKAVFPSQSSKSTLSY